MNKLFFPLLLISVVMISSCTQEKKNEFTGAPHEVKLITLNPGHFHAALVQKEMYEQVNPDVFIYAPEGADLDMHLQRIDRFNQRDQNPTTWNSEIYVGDDYLEKMLAEKEGNVVVIAGNNRKKTSYIMQAVEAGLNVLSDKPMAINIESFQLLQDAFKKAEENNVLLYDIMTERYDITSQLQRDIALIPEIFGQQEKGSSENPAVVKESVHHFFKYVSGAILRRPPWYFDTNQQGEGIVDVTTHLVDLVQWICFPDRIINYQTDIDVYQATRRPTNITRQQFLDVTGLDHIPDYLGGDGDLSVYANGEMQYTINDVHARVSVIWDYAAPEGGGDTHFSLMKGTKSHLIIRQGKEQGFLPVLFIVPTAEQNGVQWSREVQDAFAQITQKYPGITLTADAEGFRVEIPTEYRIGHEAHFAKVTEKYLGFLVDGKLPQWEIPNMLAKYYTTTRAWEIANQK
jgi:predicted dehydrogenase